MSFSALGLTLVLVGANVDAGVFAASPTSLGAGLLVGPTAEVALPMGPLSAGVRLRLGFVEEPDLSWRVAHSELRGEVFGAYLHAFGMGAVGARLGVGALWVREVRTRHQGDRLDDAQVDAQRIASTGGLLASLSPQWRVRFLQRWAVIVEVGPTLGILFSGEDRIRVGWAGSVQVGYAFGAPDR